MLFPIIEESGAGEIAAESIKLRGQEHILVVEDEPSLARLYEISLTQLGYQVSLGTDGTQALTMFQAQPEAFQLVFSDQTMPNMTGIELCREVIKLRPTQPIILATGYDVAWSEEEVDALGISHFLMKPIKIADLTQLIRDILDREL